MQKIIDRIQKERNEAGLSYAKLGDLTTPKMSPQQVYQILAGRDAATLQTLDRLLKPFDLCIETEVEIKKIKKSEEILAS